MAKRIKKEDEALKGKKQKVGEDENLPGYPVYPPAEDIYNTDDQVDADPENPAETIRPEIDSGTPNENELGEPILLSDLDVPGSELDDEQEEIGNEDEENNYYSLSDDELDLDLEEDLDDEDLDDEDLNDEDLNQQDPDDNYDDYDR